MESRNVEQRRFAVGARVACLTADGWLEGWLGVGYDHVLGGR